jgi:hypothetical protein
MPAMAAGLTDHVWCYFVCHHGHSPKRCKWLAQRSIVELRGARVPQGGQEAFNKAMCSW